MPSAWKLIRLALWGRINFNDLSEWENCYEAPPPEKLEKLTNRIPNIVLAALKLTEPHNKILEVSAGFGNYIGKVSSSKVRHATEFSPAAVNHLQSIGIKTHKAVLPKLPYEDGSFDLVTTFSVFEHLPKKAIVRESFEECHRVTREAMIFSVPFDCMQPWNTLIHNFDFTKELILEYTDGLFSMDSWEVVKDGSTTRSISYLKKL